MELNKDIIIDQVTALVVEYGPKLIGAIVFLFVGLWLIKAVMKTVSKLMERGEMDESLKPFLLSLAGAILKVMLGISVLGMVGIEMTSFIAILGAAGLAVGMALSGTLQNFAGGVMLLVLKPFKVGDVIEAQGYTGSVREIQIFSTILTTPDNKTIFIPNGGLSTSSMINYSTQDRRRVDWIVGIGYGDDVDKARALIQKMCDADTRILTDPAVVIAVSELGASSVNFAVKAWVVAADYWDVYYQMNENVYKTFNQEGISIPFPQMDVHVHNTKEVSLQEVAS